MAEGMHPLAPHHLPGFISHPGETDPLMTGAAIFLVIMVLLMGSLYFRLHALPEKLAHRGASHQQFQLVAVLSLLALFTHNNWFWIAALVLALVPIPDFWAPLANMAESLGRMANWRARSAAPVENVPRAPAENPLPELAQQARPADTFKATEDTAGPPVSLAGNHGATILSDQAGRTMDIPAKPLGSLPAGASKP